jgi:hypothetical protein
MCTVTFSPRQTGYCLGMNRDEKLTRVRGLPPARREYDGWRILCPSEPAGGTWIAVNDRGTAFALINWYSVMRRARGLPRSRGEIIPRVSNARVVEEVTSGLEELPLKRFNPFRLAGVFPNAGKIAEWRWDLQRLQIRSHRWRSGQWISSGYDEPGAQKIRRQTFRRAQEQVSAGTLGWLRRLHRSHAPRAGPYSTCMHRADAATVSYTEISVQHRRAIMGYVAGPPCASGGLEQILELRLKPPGL